MAVDADCKFIYEELWIHFTLSINWFQTVWLVWCNLFSAGKCVHKKTATIVAVIKSKMVAGGGFEPPKASLADLQSAPFDRSGIQPYFMCGIGTGAGNGSRTRISSLEGWCTAVMPYPQDQTGCIHILYCKWYRRRESNPHSSRNTDLNRARLPIPPRRLTKSTLHWLVHVTNIYQCKQNANHLSGFFEKILNFYKSVQKNLQYFIIVL